MHLEIAHLLEYPEHTRLVAGWIYHEFWTEKAGYSVGTFETLLRGATDPDRIPLSLLALADDRPVGTVNLVHSDSQSRPDLHPWLAALVVTPEHRRHGIGSALVRTLVGEAGRIGVRGLYLGTDIPDFYARLGATLHEQLTDTLCIMRIDIEREPPSQISPPSQGAR